MNNQILERREERDLQVGGLSSCLLVDKFLCVTMCIPRVGALRLGCLYLLQHVLGPITWVNFQRLSIHVIILLG